MRIELTNQTGYTYTFQVDGSTIEMKVIARSVEDACYKLRQMFLNAGPANMIEIDAWED